jgi:hypothetical protein
MISNLTLFTPFLGYLEFSKMVIPHNTKDSYQHRREKVKITPLALRNFKKPSE